MAGSRPSLLSELQNASFWMKVSLKINENRALTSQSSKKLGFLIRISSKINENRAPANHGPKMPRF
jgi:hypothetical protein